LPKPPDIYLIYLSKEKGNYFASNCPWTKVLINGSNHGGGDKKSLLPMATALPSWSSPVKPKSQSASPLVMQ